MNPMTMKDWIEALDNQIIAHKRKVLIDKGRISHKQAIEKAEKEFAIYRKREMDLLESDFDKEIKRLKDKNDNNPNSKGVRFIIALCESGWDVKKAIKLIKGELIPVA